MTSGSTPGTGAGHGLDLRRLASGGTISLAGAVVSAAVNLLLVLVVTRGFGKEAAGAFFVTTSLFLILAAVARIGTDTSLVRFVARLQSLGRGDEVLGCARVALLAVACTSTAVGAALFLSADLVGRLLDLDGSHDVVVAQLRALAPFLLPAALLDLWLAGTRGFDRMLPTVLVEKIGRSVVQVAAVAGAAALHAGPAGLALAWASSYAVAALAAALVWRRLAGSRRGQSLQTRRADPALLREFWSFTGPRAVSRIFEIALQRLDVILVGALLTASDAAVYTAVTRFLVVGLFVTQSIQQVMQPRMAAALSTGDLRLAGLLYRASTAASVAAGWPVYLALVALAPAAVAVVFGDGYVEGSSALRIVAVAMLVAIVSGPVDVLLLMGGRSLWSLGNTTLALVTQVALNLALLPVLGIDGAALAWAASILVRNGAGLYQVHRSLRLHPFGWVVGLLAAGAALCFGLLPWLLQRWTEDWRWAALGILTGGLAYLAGLLARRRSLVRQLLPGPPARPTGSPELELADGPAGQPPLAG